MYVYRYVEDAKHYRHMGCQHRWWQFTLKTLCREERVGDVSPDLHLPIDIMTTIFSIVFKVAKTKGLHKGLQHA